MTVVVEANKATILYQYNFRFSLILILVIAGADLPSDPSSTDCDQ